MSGMSEHQACDEVTWSVIAFVSRL